MLVLLVIRSFRYTHSTKLHGIVFHCGARMSNAPTYFAPTKEYSIQFMRKPIKKLKLATVKDV